MKKHVLLCIDMIARLQEGGIQVGKGYQGVLTMTEENELVEFDEFVKKPKERNPLVWSGEHINVHKNKQGRYMIQLKQTELTCTLDPCKFADAIFVEIERAQKEMGL